MSTNRLSRWSLAGALAMSASVPATVADQGAPVQRSIYVTATDQRGQPVSSLAPADLVVREAGRDRPVERVSAGPDRMHIAIAVDELVSANSGVRQAVFQLRQRLHAAGEVALHLIGLRNEQRVPYGTDLSAFLSALNAFPPRAQYPGNLVESLRDIARDQGTREGRRVVIVVAPEIPQRSGVTAEGVFDQLRDHRVMLYAATVVTGPTRPGTMQELPPTRLEGSELTEEIERDRVLGDGPRRSGGLRVPAATPEGVAEALDRIADDLLTQYQITYVLPPGTRSDGRITITARRNGLRLRGPNRLPEVRGANR